MLNAWLFAAAITGYILGSLPFGYLVARAHGVDIFKVGSGNPGATNVKRVLGSKAGNTVLVLDILKGALAASWYKVFWSVRAGRLFNSDDFTPNDNNLVLWMALTGVVAAVLGHSFSIFTKFRGGKGVATAAGGLVVLIPLACAIAGATWVIVFFAFRYVSLASIMGAVAVITASWLLPTYELPLRIIVSVLGGFVILRHHENIKRLLNGTESKFAKKPPAQP